MEHLIPSSWFTPMPQWLLITISAGALYSLIRGADLLVEGASGLAVRLGMPKVILGATIVSLGTTTPEAAVSVMAAWGGQSGLALGNAVGSVIADTGLIFGLGCLMARHIPADRFLLNRQGWVQFGVAALLAAFCYLQWATRGPEAAVERWVGFVLLAILCWYLWVSVRWGRQRQASASSNRSHEDATGSIPRLVFWFALGMTLVVVFSHVLIVCVTETARRLEVPEVILASTLVALGTSLPELVVGITAVRKGHVELLIGNVIGADILNILFVTGASASAARLPLIDPLSCVPEIFLLLHLPTMLIVLALFRVFIFRATRTGGFRRWYGVPMVALYAVYLALNLMFAR